MGFLPSLIKSFTFLDFDQAQQVAQAIMSRQKLQVKIVDEKISTVGVLLKLNSTVDGYIERSSYGKAMTY